MGLQDESSLEFSTLKSYRQNVQVLQEKFRVTSVHIVSHTNDHGE